MSETLKQKVESVLFAAGKRLSEEDVATLCRTNNLDEVRAALNELTQDYDAKGGSLVVVQEDNFWKLTVKNDYLSLVRKLVSKTDLRKGVLETLAILAAKAPMLQSELIRIRTNKGYDHLAELESQGFITRERKGRTKLIKLASRFFDYFDLPPDELKKRFARVNELEMSVYDKEQEKKSRVDAIEKHQEELKKREEEYKKHAEQKHRELDGAVQEKEKTIELLDAQGTPHDLEVFEEDASLALSSEKKIELVEEKLGTLTVFDEQNVTGEENVKKRSEEEKEAKKENDERPKEKKEETAEIKEEQKKEIVEQEKEMVQESHDVKDPFSEESKPEKEFAGEGVFAHGTTQKIEDEIDRKVENIVHPPKEEDEEEDEEEKEENDKEERGSGAA